MSEFNPTNFVFGDRAGQGRWEVGHYRQHLNYVKYLVGLSNPILIPDYPLLTMGQNDLQRRLWLESHQEIHTTLRTYSNVTGIDLSSVNFKNAEEFNTWLDSHAEEHALIDAAFGL